MTRKKSARHGPIPREPQTTGPQRRFVVELDPGLITALRREAAKRDLTLDRLVNDILGAAVAGNLVAAILDT